MARYKVGETIWVLHETKYRKQFRKVEVVNCWTESTNVWYKLPNGEIHNALFHYADKTRKGLIDKLINDLDNEFVKDTDEIREQIRALNQKMLDIEARYNSELDFLKTQREGDGN